jgi:hypothetical protein
MKVTIVVPTKGRHKNLEQFFEKNLLGLPQDWRILVVDASSAIYSMNVVEPRFEVVSAIVPGQFNQKMQGAEIARTTHNAHYVIFMDDDIIMDSLAYSTLAEELEKDEWSSGQVVAASLNIVNFKSSKNILRTILSAGNAVGQVFRSTYTTSLSNTTGSPKVQWVLGGACIWSTRFFSTEIPEFEVIGKAYCEDLFLSTWAKNKGLGDFVSLSQVACFHDDQYESFEGISSKGMLIKDGWTNGKNEMKARKMMVAKFPENFSMFNLRLHTIYQGFLGLIYGAVTLSFKRISYNLGRLFSL